MTKTFGTFMSKDKTFYNFQKKCFYYDVVFMTKYQSARAFKLNLNSAFFK